MKRELDQSAKRCRERGERHSNKRGCDGAVYGLQWDRGNSKRSGSLKDERGNGGWGTLRS
jgi:hypothetical protein